MKILILKDLLDNTSSVDQGLLLFLELKKSYEKSEEVILEVDKNLLLSSSFLNSSIGAFLDDYGLISFRKTVKFKGSKNQFNRLKKYIDSYASLYLA